MTRFIDLALDPLVQKAVIDAGYETPTPIQIGAIPPALEGKDVLGIAQTGTGKTACFVLPMITILSKGRARARMPRSLVLAPTRELAAQVAENFDTYAKYTKLTKALLIGGVSFGEQDRLIDRGVDVLIATPGRLLDHFGRGKLLLSGVQIMVVDEADRMLDMGFIPDIERIFELTPPLTRQTLFFSATMAPEIERITKKFLHSPVKIEVDRRATASEMIEQRLIEINSRRDQASKDKRDLLRAIIRSEGAACTNAILFCNRKTEVDVLAKSMKSHGFNAAPIHGDLDQSQRTRTLDGFRDGTLQFLVASDVAARGLDIPAVSHIFNFDVPSHAEDYIHRIGRTGRAGRKGIAVTLATPSDAKYLAAIEALVKAPIPRVPSPEGFAAGASNGPEPALRSEGESRRPSRSRSRPAKAAAPDSTAPGAVGETAQPRQRRPRRDSRTATAVVEPARPAAAATAAAEEAQVVHQDEPPRTVAISDAAPRGELRHDDRRRSGDSAGRHRGDRSSPVVGMGEHFPDFLGRSFQKPVKSE